MMMATSHLPPTPTPSPSCPNLPTFDPFNVILILLLLHTLIELISHSLAFIRINRRPRSRTYTLQPTALDFTHIFSFILLTIPYHVHAMYGIFHCTKRYLFPSTRKPILPEHPVRLALECSLVNFVQPAPELGKAMFRLRIEHFLSPIFPGQFDCSLLVEFDINTLKISTFLYNGLVIDNYKEQVSLLMLTAATATHPAVHKHQDEHYSYRHRAGSMYGNLFLHGPLLNEYAYFYAGILFRHGVAWFKTVLEENAMRVQPRHCMESYRRLMPHSRYVRFAMGARQILFQLVRIHGVGVDAEMMFVNTVIHSMDHAFPSCFDEIYMEHEVTTGAPFYNLVRAFFYDGMSRNEMFGTNYLVDNQNKNMFYADLYRGFRKIDEELADRIMLSISF